MSDTGSPDRPLYQLADAELLALAHTEQREGVWAELWKRHNEAVVEAVRAKFGSELVGPKAAEDAVQEAWAECIRSIPSRDWATGSFRSFLLHLARLRALDSTRRFGQSRRFHQAVSESEASDVPARPESDPAEQSEELAAVLAAVIPHLPTATRGELQRWGRGELTADELVRTLRRPPGHKPVRPSPEPSRPAVGSSVPAPPPSTLEQLAEELVRLENQHPPPDPLELDGEWAWVEENWGKPVLAPYRGKHVAVFGGRVVGSDNNPLALRLKWAKTLNVHPERLAVVYLPNP